MRNILQSLYILGITAVWLVPTIAPAIKTGQPPQAKELQAQALQWLDTQQPRPTTRVKVEQFWQSLPTKPTGNELLDCIVATFAQGDHRAAALVDLCSRPHDQATLPNQKWLLDEKTLPLLANNLRLLYGRWLVQQGFYDDARQQLANLEPNEVVAPASLLFHQAVIYHALVEKDRTLNTLDRLLTGTWNAPQRYITLARLMQEDLGPMEGESLDHIARRMKDIRRRLDLGQANKKVLQIEQEVIESLDKLIKRLEDQQAQSGTGSGNLQPSRPAQDSVPMGGKGRGEVTRKAIGSQNGWGNLPPKQREEAMQQIGRDFPAHYRDVIEQYFRKLATEHID